MSRARQTTALALWAGSALFVASGATGLAYEVIWFKRFGQLFGSSSSSIAAVVASFLFGLGVGARLFGRIADRARRPFALYALLEVAIGLLGLAIHWEIGALLPFAARVQGALAGSPFALAAARFALAFLVLGPPTLLMGGTLPLLVRQFAAAAPPGALGSATAWLYFANSLGAALGAWYAGFHLLPDLGLLATNAVVVAANLAIALAAWFLAPEFADLSPPPREEEAAQRLPRPIAWAAFVSGTGSIVLQMVWTRWLAVQVGGTTYAFSAILAVFVLGLAAGSLAYRLLVRPGTRPELPVGLACLGVVAGAFLGYAVRYPVNQLAGQLHDLRADPGFNALVCVGAAAVLQGPATFCMGVLFPALVDAAGASSALAGRTVGRLYAWNTVGAILGATVTAPLLLPVLGSFGTMAAVLATYAALALLVFPPAGGELRALPAGLSAAALGLVLAGGLLLFPSEEDHVRTNMGQYLYGPSIYEQFAEDTELLFFREAPSANVMVVRVDGTKNPAVGQDVLVNVRTNGKVDGGNGSDMQTQVGTAYLPRLLRPDAARVLVVGFGTGTTVGASLLFPGTLVDCAEIEPAMVAASPHFHAWNHAPEESPNFRAVFEDGRNWIQSTADSYDLIISEPSNPWIAGIGNLYTVEFYEAVRERLTSRGLLGQWIQAYQLSAKELGLIAATIRSVFPHVGLLRINDLDLMVLASAAPIVPPAESIDRAQELLDALEVPRAELLRHFGSDDVRTLLLSYLALDEAGIDRVIEASGNERGPDGRMPVNTDLNLSLEFDAPRQLFRVFQDELLLGPVARAVLGAVRHDMYQRLIEGWGWTEPQLEGILALRRYFLAKRMPALAVDVGSLGRAYGDDHPQLLADHLLYAPQSDPAEFAAELRRLAALSLLELQRVAAGLGQAGRPQLAVAAFEELARHMPDSATVFAGLAVLYEQLGRPDEADRMAVRARDLDPLNESAVIMLRNHPRELPPPAGQG